jgi:hypothetical protein
VATASCGSAGVVVAAGWVTADLEPRHLIAIGLGLASALVAQRVQLAWFAAGVARTEGTAWLSRIPPALSPLRRPLRAVTERLEASAQALADSRGREQLREVEMDALGDRLAALQTELDEVGADFADLLELVERGGPAAVPRIEAFRSVGRLRALADGPASRVAVGDVLAGIVARRPEVRGRIVVESALPALHAPAGLVEALVEALVNLLLPAGPVSVSGRVEGGLAVVILRAGRPVPESDPAAAVAARAARLLGGEVGRLDGAVVAAVPLTHVPGMRAVGGRHREWDLPDAV